MTSIHWTFWNIHEFAGSTCVSKGKGFTVATSFVTTHTTPSLWILWIFSIWSPITFDYQCFKSVLCFISSMYHKPSNLLRSKWNFLTLSSQNSTASKSTSRAAPWDQYLAGRICWKKKLTCYSVILWISVFRKNQTKNLKISILFPFFVKKHINQAPPFSFSRIKIVLGHRIISIAH